MSSALFFPGVELCNKSKISIFLSFFPVSFHSMMNCNDTKNVRLHNRKKEGRKNYANWKLSRARGTDTESFEEIKKGWH